MYAQPSAPRSIGGVLDDAIRLYRQSFSHCWPLTLCAAALLVVPGIILNRRTQAAAADPQAAFELFASPSFWLMLLVIVAVYLALNNALLARISAVATGASLSLQQALAIGTKLVPRALAVSVLFMLMVALGFVLLVIPGIYLLGVFQLAFIALIVENTGVFESFKVSRRLIKGHWWRSATILAVGFIIVLVFSLIAGIVSGVVAAWLRADQNTLLIVQQLISALGNVFLMSMMPSVMMAMYYDLKLRSEGTDLAERVEALPA